MQLRGLEADDVHATSQNRQSANSRLFEKGFYNNFPGYSKIFPRIYDNSNSTSLKIISWMYPDFKKSVAKREYSSAEADYHGLRAGILRTVTGGGVTRG